VSGGCKHCPISVKRNPKAKTNMVISEYTVRYHVVMYCILFFYILFGGSHSKPYHKLNNNDDDDDNDSNICIVLKK